MKIISESTSAAAYRHLRGYLADGESIKQSVHALRSGTVDKFFVDFDFVVNDPRRCQSAVDLFVAKLQQLVRRERVDGLAFLEKARDALVPSGGTVGAVRLAGAISIASGVPNFVIRMSKDIIAERIKLPHNTHAGNSALLTGASIVVITDHCSTGKELLSAIETISAHGGRVVGVIAYTVRTDLVDWHAFTGLGLPKEEKFLYIHELSAVENEQASDNIEALHSR
jgi:orotate phosphoribosyltransferase